jgi:hypothetical protein
LLLLLLWLVLLHLLLRLLWLLLLHLWRLLLLILLRLLVCLLLVLGSGLVLKRERREVSAAGMQRLLQRHTEG